MKNTISKHHEAVLAVVKKQPISIDSLKEELPKVSHVMLIKAVKDLMADNSIVLNDDGTYSFAGAEKKAEKKNTAKEIISEVSAKAAGTKEKKEEDLGAATVSGRDYSKYDFNGLKALSKSRLVLTVVQKIVADRPKIVLKELQTLLNSATIQKRYNIVLDVNSAKKIGANRYFMKKDEVIRLHNGVTICCTNQWSSLTLKPFLAIITSK